MKKQHILITGASRGIGRDLARQLAGQGHSVLAIARDESRLARLSEEAGDDCLALPYDLTQPDEDTLKRHLEDWNRLDIIVNNAGYLVHKPFEELREADWAKLFDVNFFGAVRLLQTCLPYLRRSEAAHVVNISSMGGYQGSSKFPGLAGYSASKGALSILSECLAEEWKEGPIRVNCLALGAVQTEMLEAAFPGLQAPLESEDMAGFIAWFALHGHRFFNGKVLPVSVSTP